MKLLRATRKSRTHQAEDMIVFAVNGTRFAIAANAVDEIRNMDGLHPYSPGAGRNPKVRYTLVREDKAREANGANGRGKAEANRGQDHLYFVVDASSHFHLPASRVSRVLLLRDCATAVLVDSIDRMMQIGSVTALPQAFSGEECAWYRGLAVVDEKVIPVMNPSSFLSKAEVAVLQAGAKAAATCSAGAEGAASA